MGILLFSCSTTTIADTREAIKDLSLLSRAIASPILGYYTGLLDDNRNRAGGNRTLMGCPRGF